MEEIDNLAKECLNCKNPMCKKGCPILTNIPEFIQCVKTKNMEKAYEILQKNNIMSQICSMICPVEEQCVGHCIKGIKNNAVRINRLEELVNIWGKKNNIAFSVDKKEENNKKVAIIGGGPTGIACAVELRKYGYDVTIFEKEEKIGGILEYEIPDFRLKKGYVQEIEEKINKLGIKIKTQTEFGKTINFNDLNKQEYEAVFLGIGANISKKYSLTETDSNNIYTASTILRKYHSGEKINDLGKVAVIGGGNVAMDVARTLKKVKNESVTVIYRRTKELMPAIQEEQADAKKEGVNFIFNTRVIKAIVNENNKLERIKCIKTKIDNNNKAVDVPGSEYEINVNTVIFAIGSGIDKEFLHSLKIETEDNLVKIDENGMTNINGVFAGGDLIEKNQTVCRAIASGKKAAKGIDEYIKNGHSL